MSMYNLGKTCRPSPHRGFLDRIASVERQLHERLPESCNLRGHLKQFKKINRKYDEWAKMSGLVLCRPVTHTHTLAPYLWALRPKVEDGDGGKQFQSGNEVVCTWTAAQRRCKRGPMASATSMSSLTFSHFGVSLFSEAVRLLDLSFCRSDTCTRHHALWAPHRWHPKAQTRIAVVQGNVIICRFCFWCINELTEYQRRNSSEMVKRNDVL